MSIYLNHTHFNVCPCIVCNDAYVHLEIKTVFERTTFTMSQGWNGSFSIKSHINKVVSFQFPIMIIKVK